MQEQDPCERLLIPGISRPSQWVCCSARGSPSPMRSFSTSATYLNLGFFFFTVQLKRERTCGVGHPAAHIARARCPHSGAHTTRRLRRDTSAKHVRFLRQWWGGIRGCFLLGGPRGTLPFWGRLSS